MALCDSLCPSRRAPLPSLGDTLRCACRFAPGGPGRPTAGLGCVIRSPPPESSRREAVRVSQVPVQPAVPMPCSSTPAGPHAPGHCGAATRPPLCPRRRLPRFIQLSRLNRTALGLAVYASPGALPHKTQNSLPAAGQALPGGDWCPAGLLRKVSDMIVLLSRAYLAQGHPENTLNPRTPIKRRGSFSVCQEVHREGRRPRTPLPADHRQPPPLDGRSLRNPPRPARPLRSAPPRPDQGRGPQRGGRIVGPLHQRPLLAGQSDQRHRRGGLAVFRDADDVEIRVGQRAFEVARKEES